MDFGRIPELWMNAITKPAETFKKEKKNAKLLDGVIHYFIAGFIVGLITTVISIFLILFHQIPNEYLSYGAGVIMLMSIFYPIIYPVFLIIATLFLACIFFVMAKILGGKGNFGTQYYLWAIFYAPIIIIINLISLIPIIGNFISLAILIYALYLLTLSIKEAHELDTIKAILVWLIPGIVIAIIIVLLIFMLPNVLF